MATIARTIEIARQHAARGDVPAACRVLDLAMRAALTSRTYYRLYAVRCAILDASIDAMVARSQARRA